MRPRSLRAFGIRSRSTVSLWEALFSRTQQPSLPKFFVQVWFFRGTRPCMQQGFSLSGGDVGSCTGSKWHNASFVGIFSVRETGHRHLSLLLFVMVLLMYMFYNQHWRLHLFTVILNPKTHIHKKIRGSCMDFFSLVQNLA